MNQMQLVEQHVIGKHDPRYAAIDEAALKSKNLYNAALYETRQAYIFEGRYVNYNEMDKRMQSHEAYKVLPAKVSQQILMGLDRNWKSFFEARKRYECDLSKPNRRTSIKSVSSRKKATTSLKWSTSKPSSKPRSILPIMLVSILV